MKQQRPVESTEEPHSNLPRVHIYEIRPRKDKRGVDLISDALPFGRLWYGEPDDAIGYAQHCSRSPHLDFNRQQVIDHVSAAIGVAMQRLRSPERIGSAGNESTFSRLRRCLPVELP